MAHQQVVCKLMGAHLQDRKSVRVVKMETIGRWVGGGWF